LKITGRGYQSPPKPTPRKLVSAINISISIMMLFPVAKAAGE